MTVNECVCAPGRTSLSSIHLIHSATAGARENMTNTKQEGHLCTCAPEQLSAISAMQYIRTIQKEQFIRDEDILFGQLTAPPPHPLPPMLLISVQRLMPIQATPRRPPFHPRTLTSSSKPSTNHHSRQATSQTKTSLPQGRPTRRYDYPGSLSPRSHEVAILMKGCAATM